MAATGECKRCGASLLAGATRPLCTGCEEAARAETWVESRRSESLGPGSGRTAVVTLDRPAFRRAVLEAGLVVPEVLTRVETVAPGDATELARALVREGKLTPYQAGAVLQGKARGLLIGEYVVLDKAGQGGMGVVFQARHRSSGRVVALKILPPSFARDPDAVRRFRREFEMASRLKHPNLVAGLEANEDRGVHFLALEYITGHDLSRLVARGGPLPVPLALHCTIQVARGLEAAHSQGVVHRDVKPGNVMLDDAGAVRLLDLGLARVIEASSPFAATTTGSLTQSGAYLGTVDYLAPEQANNAKRVDARADIYSLGCTLFYLLTGQPPFPESTLLKRLLAHQEQSPPSLRAVRLEVPEALETLYRSMLAKRPDDRPATMSEVLRALEACRDGSPAQGHESAELRGFAWTALERPEPREVRPESSADETPAPPAPFALNLVIDERLDEPIVAAAAPARDGRVLWGIAAVVGAVAVIGMAALAYERVARRGSREAESKRPAELVKVVKVPVREELIEPEPVSESVSLAPEPEAPPPVAAETVAAAAPEVPSTPAPTAAKAPAAPVPLDPLLGGVIYEDEFRDPESGWYRDSGPVLEGGPPYRHDYENGLYFSELPEGWDGAENYNCTDPLDTPFQVEAIGRVKGWGQSDGAWGLLISRGDNGRGFQVGIDRAGRVAVERSFRGVKKHPEDPEHYLLPTAHPAIRPGGEWNTLTLRVRKRSLEVRVNGKPIGRPLVVDWDVLPAMPAIAAFKPMVGARIRVEYERVEVRALKP